MCQSRACSNRCGGDPHERCEHVALTPEILVRRDGDDWSAQEHIGHLLDLEVLWRTRLGQLIAGEAELVAADMSNQRTYDASHNDASLDHILALFRESRKSMLSQLDELTEKQVVATALHPRLKQAMRLIDLCHFVAEHDDHHLAIIHELLRDAR